MKAVVFEKYGSPDDLRFKEVDRPVPAENEVLIKVRAASINSWDWELLRGTPFVNRIMFGLLKPKKINILGCDIAGSVEAVGKKVTHFIPGDEVFGDISHAGWGGFAEYVCVRENVLARKSPKMTFEQAAAIPQAGVLALQGLYNKGPIQKGQKVLINGAGGGVGTFAIQMVKAEGAEVTAVDRGDKLEMLQSLGAHHVIDYTRDDFTKNGKQYDLILDVAAYRSVFDYKRALKPKGIFVIVGGSMSLVLKIVILGPLIALITGKKLGLLVHKPAVNDLKTMTELFENGRVIPVIDKKYSLREVPEAIQYLGEGHTRGKVVITI